MGDMCIDDYSTHCASYGCNACGRFPSSCERCWHGEEADWEETGKVDCMLDQRRHDAGDTCENFKPEY